MMYFAVYKETTEPLKLYTDSHYMIKNVAEKEGVYTTGRKKVDFMYTSKWQRDCKAKGA